MRVLRELKKAIEKNPVPRAEVKPTATYAQETHSDGGSSNYEQKLRKLKNLYEQGLISKEVFEKKQQELLDAALE